MDASLERLLEAEVRDAGFTLYHWRLRPGGKRRILQVFLHSEGGVLLDECARVSRRLAAAIEEAGAIDGPYVLEVSSPGLDRALLKPWHYEISRGARIRLVQKQGPEESRSLEGTILGLDGDCVRLGIEDQEEVLPLSTISKARVVPELSIRRGKATNSDGGK